MTRTKPPFRADVVGSILRTAPLKEARAKREKGEISAAQLKEVEDREIEKIIKKQEEVGLQGARPTANFAARGGISISTACSTASRSRSSITASSFRACRPGRARRASTASSASPATRCWSISSFSRRTRRVTPKMCIPSPATLHFRLEPERHHDQGLCRPQRHLRRSGENLSPGHPRLLRRRLPLSAIRRHRLGLSVLAGRAEKGARARTQRRPAAAGLCPRHQCGARRQAGRHGDHDPYLPRQFPLDLDFRRRLRAGRRNRCSAS